MEVLTRKFSGIIVCDGWKPYTKFTKWSEPLQVDNELSNINSWRELHEEDEAALRPRIQDISSSRA
jgi:hypothetical protein